MEVILEDKRTIAHNVCEFVFKPIKPVEYVPGQYARYTFPFHIDDPRDKQHRTFTLTSHPSDDDIRIITRLDPPLSVYKRCLLDLKPGKIMHIDEPRGDAVLPRLATTPLIFVAQGIALASYLSMLTECARSNLAHQITLLWARRSEDDALKKLIPCEVPHLTRIDTHYPDRLSARDILAHIKPASLIYLSGSQRFVETLGAALEADGMPRERLIYDYYSGYANL
ncbi:FAD-dependent oxidoreductase [Candidatus Saccharibacteria bacterium]|nr:MAG: FAD-dependent oxidoreductase [Candidatus Saccharibacteria bacterium]